MKYFLKIHIFFFSSSWWFNLPIQYEENIKEKKTVLQIFLLCQRQHNREILFYIKNIFKIKVWSFFLKLRKRGIFIFASVLPSLLVRAHSKFMLRALTMEVLYLYCKLKCTRDVITCIIINPGIKDWPLPVWNRCTLD